MVGRSDLGTVPAFAINTDRTKLIVGRDLPGC
jgi:hypothetical protein